MFSRRIMGKFVFVLLFSILISTFVPIRSERLIHNNIPIILLTKYSVQKSPITL